MGTLQVAGLFKPKYVRRVIANASIAMLTTLTFLLSLFAIKTVPATIHWYILPLLGGISVAVAFLVSPTPVKKLRLSPLLVPLVLFVAVSLLSSIIQSKNSVDALLFPYGPLGWITLSLFLFILPSYNTPTFRTYVFGSIGFTLTIMSGITLLVPRLSPFELRTDSTPLALILMAGFFLAIMIKEELRHGLSHPTRKFCAISFLILVGTVATIALQIQRPATPVKLGVRESYQIMRKTVSTWQYGLLGVSPNQYIFAYTTFRPERINQTPYWDTRFDESGTVLTHITTTMGLLGLGCLLLFTLLSVMAFPRFGRSRTIKLRPFALLIAGGYLVWIVFLPPSLLFLVISLLVGGFLASSSATIDVPLHRVFRLLGGIVTAIITIASSIVLLRYATADMLHGYAKTVLRNGDGTASYLLMGEAIQRAPFRPAYYHTVATINHDTALAMVGIWPEDTRKTQEEFWQGAVNAAKAAADLAPLDVRTWEALGTIYGLLSGNVPDVTALRIASFQQAISLDPNNPILHVTLGDIYTEMGEADNAYASYERAVALKSNYALATYRLAKLTMAAGDFEKARTLLEATVGNLPTNAPEYPDARKDLQSVMAKLVLPIVEQEQKLPAENQPFQPATVDGQTMGMEETQDGGFTLPP